MIREVVSGQGRERKKAKQRVRAFWNRALIGVIQLFICVALLHETASESAARDITYTGNEEVVYVRPGDPTQVSFQGEVVGGFKPKNSSLALDRQDTYLVVFARPSLPPEGEAMIVQLKDKRTYSLRVLPASGDHPRDALVNVLDSREVSEEYEEAKTPEEAKAQRKFPPPTTVPGLMRELALVAEFGKRKGIPGYRRSNKFSGETVLSDGSLVATIDEMFLGSDLVGYVLSVENMLETSQQLNPASFRLDGTRAISMQRWELAPRPQTSEQQLAAAHKAKVYIITRASGR